MDELNFYDNIKNWNFSNINYIEENLTNWDMYDELKKSVSSKSKVLDLGTGGGEKVLEHFPGCQEIIATDFSKEMINTAKENLKRSGKKNITFRVMDNLNMDTMNDYFDVVVARHTCINAKQIYDTLKNEGKLIVRGVDKLDCYELKKMFGRGQAYNDELPISFIDYQNIYEAGFRYIELIPIHVREYYKTKKDLLMLLMKTPILQDFSEIKENQNLNFEKINNDILNEYIEKNKSEKGILLIRRYYGIIAVK